MEKLKKKLFQKDQLFFAIGVKIDNYFIDHCIFSSYTTGPMANIKSAIKKIRRISKQTVVNKARKSKFKNAIKKMNLLLDVKKKESFRFFTKIKFRINESC